MDFRSDTYVGKDESLVLERRHLAVSAQTLLDQLLLRCGPSITPRISALLEINASIHHEEPGKAMSIKTPQFGGQENLWSCLRDLLT